MSTNGSLPFKVFDADSTVVEPPEVWTQYLDPEYRILARSSLWHEVGEVGAYTILNGRQVSELSRPTFPFDEHVAQPLEGRLPRHAIWRPGMTDDDVAALDPATDLPLTPGAQDPEARLKDMDAMGISGAVLYPYYFSEFFPLVENPEVAAALARAYNDWLLDFSKADPRRLVPAAVLPVQNVNLALKELRRAVELGYKTVVIRPMFVYGRFLNHPYYDPLWAEIARLGVTAAIRPTLGAQNPEWTSHAPFVERVSAGFGTGHTVASTIAPVMDNSMALLMLLGHAHFTRFPDLKVFLTNGKASWVPLIIEKSEGYLKIRAINTTIPVRVDSDEVFEESGVRVQFDADELAVQVMHDFFSDIAVWGSHYPSQVTNEPRDAISALQAAKVPDGAIEKLMGGNAAAMFDVTL